MNPVKILTREVQYFSKLQKMLKSAKDISPDSENIVADDIERTADKFAARVAFRFEGEDTTYAQFEAQANRVANWGLSVGLKAGDAVALFMENRPDYVAVWFGCAKIGVTVALINHNLEGEALAHCINIADARWVITGAEQDRVIHAAVPLLKNAPKIATLGGAEGDDLVAELGRVPDTRPARTHRAALRGKDLCLLVYTSGTTGLPKAARLTQARTQGMMRTFITPCNVTHRDRVYITLPLYHGTGGICGVGIAINTGAAIILRRKFSASAFWEDAAREEATVFTYIGELCRYLVNQPPHPKERAHKIRTGFGNGLRPEVWEEFLKRFNIPHLCEFYGSTEGNVSFLNFDGKTGAVGRIPGWLQKSFAHIAFVKFDVDTEMPVRGADGFCVRAGDDEAGEAIGLIGDDIRNRFEGYNDPAATQKKILRDVFVKGDLWFRTGDLLRKDKHGYIYFIDRLGDTFRWKGENVSTNEVAEAFGGIDGIETANIYGVPVPGADGKAGMAAITSSGSVDIPGLYARLAKRLPAYAIPLFIRVQKEADTTGTFKYRKTELVAEGFDPTRTEGDALFVYEPASAAYVALTPERHAQLRSGTFRF